MNFKKPLKMKRKDINGQSKANKYIFCIGKYFIIIYLSIQALDLFPKLMPCIKSKIFVLT
tara:strand:- start:51 stop:230 length:180 start_codon:yes stop_codon:yes gene_type:complete